MSVIPTIILAQKLEKKEAERGGRWSVKTERPIFCRSVPVTVDVSRPTLNFLRKLTLGTPPILKESSVRSGKTSTNEGFNMLGNSAE